MGRLALILCLTFAATACGGTSDRATTASGDPPPVLGGTFETLTAAGSDVVQGPPDEAPDRPRGASAFVLDGAEWQHVPTVPIGPASYPFLDGARLATLDFRPGDLELELSM